MSFHASAKVRINGVIEIIRYLAPDVQAIDHYDFVSVPGHHGLTFFQNPSLLFQAPSNPGANASRIFSLVYNLKEPGLIYRRYPGVEGSAYFIGGLGVTYQRAEGIVLTPVRAGVGLRLGANVGYMNISKKRRILPL